MEKLLNGKTWEQNDPSKIDDDLDLDLDQADVTGIAALVDDGVVTADGNAESIIGTLDATALAHTVGLFDKDEIKAMGDRAAALSYDARLDAQGRIVRFDVDVPETADEKAGTWVITFAGYGQQVAQTAPAGTVKMPLLGYRILND